MHHIAVLICHNLEFNMTWIFHKTLQIHRVIGEALHRLHLGILEVRLEIFLTQGHTHAFPAAAGRCLDHDWKTDLFCHFKCFLHGIDRLFASRDNRDTSLNHGLSCRRFVSHLVNDLCRRSDERNIAFLA